jgi:hypothetical protein
MSLAPPTAPPLLGSLRHDYLARNNRNQGQRPKDHESFAPIPGAGGDGPPRLLQRASNRKGSPGLVFTEGTAEETKARYAFVYGDFRRLHRMGLIACHYRAAEWRHKEIELAAHELLQYLDRKSA